MNKYPEFIELKNGTQYKINTDFRIALKCNEISMDQDIGDYEKSLAIIYTLFGDEALNDFDNHGEMLNLAIKYLRRGVPFNERESQEEPSMDFKQDEGYIKASFMSDYKIDLDRTEMHWYIFYDLLSGLTDDSILSRVRTIREEPLAGKKGKERERWEKAKRQVALKYEKTKEQKELDKFWEKIYEKR